MNRNLIALTIILILLAGTYFLVFHGKGGSSFEPEDVAFSIEDTASVTRIDLTLYSREEKKKTLSLSRTAEGNWKVQDLYEVQPGKIMQLLGVMHNLIVKEQLTEEGRKTAIAKLKQNHTQVDIYGKSGLMKSWLIGPTNPQQTGNVMLIRGREIPFLMTRPGAQEGYIYTYFSLDENDWKDKVLFACDSASLEELTVTYQDERESYELGKSGGTWRVNGVPADPLRMADYLRRFRGKVYFESFAGKAWPGVADSLRNVRPDVRFVLKARQGDTQSFSLWKREDNPNGYFALRQGLEDLLTVQHFVIDSFLTRRAWLQGKPL